MNSGILLGGRGLTSLFVGFNTGGGGEGFGVGFGSWYLGSETPFIVGIGMQRLLLDSSTKAHVEDLGRVVTTGLVGAVVVGNETGRGPP